MMRLAAIPFQGPIPIPKGDARAFFSELPTSRATYVIVRAGQRGGEDKVVYIGSAAGKRGLEARFRWFLSPEPNQSTNLRVLDRLRGPANHRLFYWEGPDLSSVRMFEYHLLAEHQREFGELPEYNREVPPNPLQESERTGTMTVLRLAVRRTPAVKNGRLQLDAEAADGTRVTFWGTQHEHWNISRVMTLNLDSGGWIRCMVHARPGRDGFPAVWVPQWSPVEVLFSDTMPVPPPLQEPDPVPPTSTFDVEPIWEVLPDVTESDLDEDDKEWLFGQLDDEEPDF